MVTYGAFDSHRVEYVESGKLIARLFMADHCELKTHGPAAI